MGYMEFSADDPRKILDGHVAYRHRWSEFTKVTQRDDRYLDCRLPPDGLCTRCAIFGGERPGGIPDASVAGRCHRCWQSP